MSGSASELEPRLKSLCNDLFGFLVSEHDFRESASAYATEFWVHYTRGELQFSVAFSFQELPWLYVRILGGKRRAEKILRFPNDEMSRQAVKQFKSERDRLNATRWVRKFRDGDYDELFRGVLQNYAERIRPLLGRVLAGDFEALKGA